MAVSGRRNELVRMIPCMGIEKKPSLRGDLIGGPFDGDRVPVTYGQVIVKRRHLSREVTYRLWKVEGRVAKFVCE